MSLATPIPRGTRSSDPYLCDGVQVTFPVPFWFIDGLDLLIKVVSPSGTVTEFTGGAGYSWTGQNNPAGGTVTMNVAPAANDTVTIIGKRVPNRLTSVYQGGMVNGGANEQELDVQTAVDQELRRDIDALAAQLAALTTQANLLNGATRSASIRALRGNSTAGLNWLTVVQAWISVQEAIDSNIDWLDAYWPTTHPIWGRIFDALNNGLPGGFTLAQIATLQGQALALTPAPTPIAARITRRKALKTLKANGVGAGNYLTIVQGNIPGDEANDINVDFMDFEWPAGGAMWVRVQGWLNAALPGGFTPAQRQALERQALAMP